MTENDNVLELDFSPPEAVVDMSEVGYLREQFEQVQALNCLLGLAILNGRESAVVLVEAKDNAHVEIETTNPTMTGKVLIEVRRDMKAEAELAAQEGLSVKQNASV